MGKRKWNYCYEGEATARTNAAGERVRMSEKRSGGWQRGWQKRALPTSRPDVTLPSHLIPSRPKYCKRSSRNGGRRGTARRRRRRWRKGGRASSQQNCFHLVLQISMASLIAPLTVAAAAAAAAAAIITIIFSAIVTLRVDVSPNCEFDV